MGPVRSGRTELNSIIQRQNSTFSKILAMKLVTLLVASLVYAVHVQPSELAPAAADYDYKRIPVNGDDCAVNGVCRSNTVVLSCVNKGFLAFRNSQV